MTVDPKAVPNDPHQDMRGNSLDSGSIIDCPAAGQRWSALPQRMAVLAGFVFLCAVVGSALLVLTWNLIPGSPRYANTLAVAAFVIPSVGAIAFFSRRQRRRFDRTVSERIGGSIPELIAEIQKECREFSQSMSSLVAARLVEYQRAPLCVRIAYKKKVVALVPFGQRFEPVPLDESVQLFVDLEWAGQTDAPPDVSNVSDDSGVRVLLRNIRLGGGAWSYCFSAVLTLVLGLFAWRGSLSSTPAILLAIWLVLLLFDGNRGAQTSALQWFLVPGGVAARSNKRFHREWTIHLFRRDTSVLIVHQSQARWTAHIADQTAKQTVSLTQREVDLLLRTWLSPLEPPPAELLSDLQ